MGQILSKNKHKRYERVKQLPNVTFSEFGTSQKSCKYPWDTAPYQDMEMTLELGCGKGEHTLAFAKSNPNRLCIGIDSKSHRLCTGAEEAINKGTKNALFLHAQIEYITDFFPSHSIDEIWLTFPDPHIKTRCIKHRLSAAPFLDKYAKLLIPGGKVFLKTDSDLLFAYTQESVALWGGKIINVSDDIYAPEPNPLYAGEIVSAFQKTAQSKNITIKFIAFELN